MSDLKELVVDLREWASVDHQAPTRCLKDAADAIESLTAEVERLKAALELCAGSCRAAQEKLTDAPCSAFSHLEEGMAAAAGVGVGLFPESYTKEAGNYRLELNWPRAAGRLEAENLALRAAVADLRKQLRNERDMGQVRIDRHLPTPIEWTGSNLDDDCTANWQGALPFL